MSRIDLYLNSQEKAFARAGDKVPWPMHVASVIPYFADLEASDVFLKIKLLSEQNVPIQTIKTLFIGPSVTRSTLMDVIAGLKSTKPPIPVDERVWFVEYIFDIIQEMQSGDIFCLDDTDRILHPREIDSLYKNTPWNYSEAQNDFGRSVYKVSASLHALMWSLYFYGWSDVGFEFHGPYEIISADGTKLYLIIRDFFDIKPTLLWESMESFPYSKIRIMALYKQDTDLHIDIFNRLFTKENLLKATVGIYIEIDNVVLKTKEEVEILHKHISQRILEQHKLVQAMSQEEVVKKFIESRYYVFRKLRMHFQEDWRPPTFVLQRVHDWGLIDISKSEPPSWEILKRGFDPRDDFSL